MAAEQPGGVGDSGRLDRLCDAYEAAWASSPPNLLAFLTENGWQSEAEDQLLAIELVCIDLEHRWRSSSALDLPPVGMRPTAADYVGLLYAPDSPPPLAWLQCERGAIRRYGEAADRAAFESRYTSCPQLLEQLAAIEESSNTALAGHGDGVHLRCPHCQHPIELVADQDLVEVLCPSCGSDFSLVGAHAAGPAAAPGDRLAHFVLQHRLGVGAFGAVWRAWDEKLERTVAVKVPRRGQFDEQQERAFVREAQNCAQLNHPNIVPVYEVGRDGDTLYIVSELVRGQTLGEALADRSFTSREAAELCRLIAAALDHAHERGVVHRDLKPSNVMLDQAGAPHLMDFGLAKREAAEITVSLDGRVLGTPAYMAPEQARGDAEAADRRSDVYALGVILFQLLTRELPFRGDTRMLLQQVQHEEPPSPRRLNSQVPKDLETITLKCLEKSPERRFASAGELEAELRRRLNGEPIHSRPISPVVRGWRWCVRRPGAATAAGAVVALALVSTVAFLVTNRARREAESLAAANAELATRKEKIVEAFVEAFRSADPSQAGGTHSMPASEVLEKARSGLSDGRLSEDPLANADLLEAIGSSFVGLGDYAASVSALKEAAKIKEAELGPNAPGTLRCQSNLARAYHNAGQTDLARPLLEVIVEQMKEVFGPYEADTLGNTMVLAASYKQAGRFDESLELLEQTREDASRELGREHKVTLLTGFHLANGYATFARLEDAVAVLEETYPALKRVMGADHVSTLDAADSLAEFYQLTGRVDDALVVARETYEDLQAKLGAESELTLQAMTNLATAYQRADDLDRAVPLLEEAMRLYRSEIGLQRRDAVFAMGLLAYAYQEAGRLEESLPIFDETLERSREVYGPDHMYTQISIAHLVQAYAEAERPREDMPVSDEEYDRAKSQWGFGHSQGK